VRKRKEFNKILKANESFEKTFWLARRFSIDQKINIKKKPENYRRASRPKIVVYIACGLHA
jgi:hypothetical protein